MRPLDPPDLQGERLSTTPRCLLNLGTIGILKHFHLCTRDDQKVCGKKLPFLHRLINRAGTTAHNNEAHMLLIDYNMPDVSCLHVLQLSPRQRYIARSVPFYVAF